MLVAHLSDQEKIEHLEQEMLQLPQAECPVVHHFGPGIYIREVTLPAGILAVGHAQRYEHLNIMLKGAVAIADEGEVKVLKAPLIFVGKPGRKVGYILEETVWQNVYATTETDVDKLEDMYLDKSDTWKSYNDSVLKIESEIRHEDQQDFYKMIADYGLDEKTVKVQSENELDQIEMPSGSAPKLTVRGSQIDGKGVFLTYPAIAGEVIAPARLNGFRTPAGRYTNHSAKPNAEFVKKQNGDIYLVAKQNILGCIAGSKGEEVTVDYRQALSLSGIHMIKGI